MRTSHWLGGTSVRWCCNKLEGQFAKSVKRYQGRVERQTSQNVNKSRRQHDTKLIEARLSCSGSCNQTFFIVRHRTHRYATQSVRRQSRHRRSLNYLRLISNRNRVWVRSIDRKRRHRVTWRGCCVFHRWVGAIMIVRLIFAAPRLSIR